MKNPSKENNFLPIFSLILFILTMTSIFVYLSIRIYLLVSTQLNISESLLSICLLLAELFILVHTVGYFINIYRVMNNPANFTPIIEEIELNEYPPVAIVVPSYKEPLEILNDTLVCFYNLSYPNKHLYLLDDTRYELPWDTEENKSKYRKEIEKLCQNLNINLFRSKWHGAKAGIINDFMSFINGHQPEDLEFHPFAEHQPTEPSKYLTVFDSDMNPFPDFLEYLVKMMESKPKLAFIQTPQYYSNFEFNRVARASGLQQAVFYEYICEGKSLQNAMFCCGTNVIYRCESLKDVGGLDEISVTEDFATSFKFHKKQWESMYLNKIAAFGMGPEDLGAFFQQQFRWARGTIGLLRSLPLEFFKNFKEFTVNQWWEYFLSSTHYLIGFVFLIMVFFPILYILLDIPAYYADPSLYLIAFLPYISLTFLLFILTLRKRNYKVFEVFSVLLLNAVSFPVYIKGSLAALLGLKSKFKITPKSGSTVLSLWSLWPQVLMSILCFIAIVWGIMRLYYEREPFYGILINIFWSFYNFVIISSFLYFNHSEEKSNVQ